MTEIKRWLCPQCSTMFSRPDPDIESRDRLRILVLQEHLFACREQKHELCQNTTDFAWGDRRLVEFL